MRFILSFILTMSIFNGYSQNGEFAIRFNDFSIDQAINQFCFNVEIKAGSPTTEFNLADQNYRFSFNRAAFVPNSLIIDSELTLSGFTDDNGVTSFYNDHTPTGSLDTVISYNVPLGGGVGYYLNSTDWVEVGRLCLTIMDYDQIGTLDFHCETQFPKVVINSKANGILYPATQADCPDVSVNFNSLLPVEFMFFKSKLQSNNTVRLDWATASEIDSKEFIVERSTDGDQFERLGALEGAGNSIHPVDYQFSDLTPENGINYYRIKQVDIDGSYTYSKIVVIDLNKKFTLNVFPNPVRDEFNINVVGDQSEQILVSATNMLGQKVWEKSYESNFDTDFQATASFAAFDDGQYIISVATSTSTKHRTIVIQH